MDETQPPGPAKGVDSNGSILPESAAESRSQIEPKGSGSDLDDSESTEPTLRQEKIDSAIAKFDSGDVDLSQDSLPETPLDNVALQESVHRIGLQQSTFSSAICAAVFLYAAAVIFGAAVIYRYCITDAPIDWHVSALAGAFIIPPTVIIIALIRAIYSKSDDKSSGDGLPALNLIKEIAVAIKEAVKAVK